MPYVEYPASHRHIGEGSIAVWHPLMSLNGPDAIGANTKNSNEHHKITMVIAT